MFTWKAFLYLPSSMEVAGLRMPVIVTGCGPTCWKCREVCHPSSSCPVKKASRSQALNLTPNLDIYPVISCFEIIAKKLMYSLILMKFLHKREPSLFRKSCFHTPFPARSPYPKKQSEMLSPSKRQRSLSSESGEKEKTIKLPYGSLLQFSDPE